MAQITFTNKQDLIVSSFPEVNKLTAVDVNLIKSVVNSNSLVTDKNKEDIASLINGNGKTYVSISNAMAALPLPSDNNPFTIRDSVSNLEDGYYIYLSTEVGGYKFLKTLEALANGYYVVNSLLDFDSLITNVTSGVWMIISDITLDANKTIPTGVILQFREAKINLSGFTLTGTNTKIDAGSTQIFNDSAILTGFLIETAYPQWFGAKGDGVNDDTAALQSALDNAKNIEGKGEFLISSSLLIESGMSIKGVGGKRPFKITTNNDISLIKSRSELNNTNGVVLSNLYLKKNVTGLTSFYDIHITNPTNNLIEKVRVQSAHTDLVYSDVNVGGIHLDRNVNGTASYLNHIDDCWIQNNAVRLTGITDSSIQRCYLWGHTREFAVGLFGSNSGALDISNNYGIITSKFKGGIYVGSSGINQLRITSNEFDGNPLLEAGIGVYLDRLTLQTIVSNNTVWGCGSHGVYAKDPVGLIIDGNNFWKNNRSDIGSDDIRIEGENFNPSRNIISNNTHLIDDSLERTNKGYAYNEIGSSPSNYPTSNTLIGNTVAPASYQSALINPYYTDDRGAKSTGNTWDAFTKDSRAKGTVNANGGTLVLDLKGGSSSTFIGIVHVSLVRSNFTAQSRNASFFVTCRGGVGQVTQLGTGDGSSGGIPLTLTISGTNTLTLTNTSTDGGQIATGMIQFNGTINRV
tara:strand:+ start:200 stop:2269 length:2070 start_codon:yes stop_codon:yes gene_type:complete